MAITKTSSRAPCPLFAGRGLTKSGFTMALPYKTFLSCQPSNIASERMLVGIYNYGLAEYVYNKGADAYAFGVYVDTGAFTDEITDGKHMFAARFQIRVTEDYSLGSGERHNCDVRGLSVSAETIGDLSGVLHGAFINVRCKEGESGANVIGGYYLSHTPTYGAIGLEVRCETPDATGDGGVTMGGATFGMVGLLVACQTKSITTGEFAAIALHTVMETNAIVGDIVGIRFDDGGLWAGSGFDTGIEFQTGTLASDGTGIIIASACATAISITGACTGPAINVTGACDQALYTVFNYTASMAAYVQGIKIEHTRASDIIVATSGVWGIQCVINQGTGYSAKMATQIYAGHFVIKGDAVNAGTSTYALVVETQSNGKVDYLEIHRMNTGSTSVSGVMVAFVSYVNISYLATFAASAGTTGNAIGILDTGGTGTITDLIETDVANTSFFLHSINGDCGYLAGVTTHDTESDEIKVQIGSVTKYIKLYT